ncbi:MAG: GTPase, partial [Candidatus Thermoplasmatota archaeon]
MPALEDQIRDIEAEIQRTPYNKATQRHIGRLKAKLARLRAKAEIKAAKAPGRSYGVRRSGHAAVGLAGLPSVGKSTLLNRITDAQSLVAPYHFTTLDVVPGILDYKGAKIQVLDMPGLISGASRGRGRGREILSVLRTLDMVLLMVDVFDTNLSVLVNEIYEAGIRLNTHPPDIHITRRERGGITVSSTLPLTDVTMEEVADVLKEFGIVSADVVIREQVSAEDVIDHVAGNRAYLRAFVVLNKIDLVNEEYLTGLEERMKGWHVIPISAEKGEGLEELKEAIYDSLRFMRIYMKPPGKKADITEPLIVKEGSTVAMVCEAIHTTLRDRFRYATVSGSST